MTDGSGHECQDVHCHYLVKRTTVAFDNAVSDLFQIDVFENNSTEFPHSNVSPPLELIG
jgi:hypothetical protein